MDDMDFGCMFGLVVGCFVGALIGVIAFSILIHNPVVADLQNAICYMEFGEGFEPSYSLGDTWTDFHCNRIGKVNEIDNTGVIVNRGG